MEVLRDVFLRLTELIPAKTVLEGIKKIPNFSKIIKKHGRVCDYKTLRQPNVSNILTIFKNVKYLEHSIWERI